MFGPGKHNSIIAPSCHEGFASRRLGEQRIMVDAYAAILMVGGFGKRLYPLTEHTPKPLLEIAGRPVLTHILEKLQRAGVFQATLCAYHQAEQLAAYIDRFSSQAKSLKTGMSLKLHVESEPSGTAGALRDLWYRDETQPVLLSNGDVLTDLNYRELFDWHVSHGNDLTVACRYHVHRIPYGVMEISLDGRVSGVDEKPAKTYPINTGTYVFNPSILKHLPVDGRLDMTDVIAILLEKGFKVGSYLFGAYWIDIGQHDDFAAAQAEFLHREASLSKDVIRTVEQTVRRDGVTILKQMPRSARAK